MWPLTINTIKTLLGFCRSVIGRWIPILTKSDSLNDIYNYLPIKNLYSTSGQPTEIQFSQIRRQGFETVINLAPISVLENSIVDEKEALSLLGLSYIHIPVDFKQPTDDDFEKFVAALEGQEASKIWVHCAANMRVSAFSYRYRVEILKENEYTARTDLLKIWEPIGVWKSFLNC